MPKKKLAAPTSFPQKLVTWLREDPLDALLIAFPVAIAMRLAGADDLWIFVVSGVAIVPLAGLMGRATESLAAHARARASADCSMPRSATRPS